MSVIIASSMAVLAPEVHAASDRTELACRLLADSMTTFVNGGELDVQGAVDAMDPRAGGESVPKELRRAAHTLQRSPAGSAASQRAASQIQDLCARADVTVPALPEIPTWPKKLNAQMARVATSIEAVHRMTPDEFLAWVHEASPIDGKDNSFEYQALTDTPFDFPYLTFEDPAAQPNPCGSPAGGVINAFNGTDETWPGADGRGTIPPHSAVYDCDYTHIFPVVPHMSLVEKNVDTPYRSSLVFYNGFLEVPLRDTQDGKAVVSFGTQIWPDGKKVTLAWISRIELPHDSRLGGDQAGFTTRPEIGLAPDRHTVAARAQQSVELTPSEHRQRLTASVNKPMLMAFFPSALGDAIPGIETDPHFPARESIIDAYFEQDAQRFDAAVSDAQARGILLGPGASRTTASHWLRDLTRIKDLESTLATISLGGEGFLTGASSPAALQ
jgi:hypothetical protein